MRLTRPLWSRGLLLVCLVALLLSLPGSANRGAASPLAQVPTDRQKAEALLAKMTPAERVGQLFLVSFQGATLDENSPFYTLLTQRHIGGVVLSRANDNIPTTDNTPGKLFTLNQLLQERVWNAAQPPAEGSGGPVTPAVPPQYVPLLIGVAQTGDAFPGDAILNGLTPLPSEMALGAAWDPTLAEQVGAVLGKELSALGFNLVLGPSLDVLDVPRADSTADLGTRAFGGSPYWVGKLGQAYISGLHQGSGERMLVIAKNFPGRGAADRSPDVEIATVSRSLDQLQQTEFVPFFTVTGASENSGVTDGLLVSHIRYQGLQGMIRTTTRSVSLDGAALDALLKLPALSVWRANGGLLVSDNLGSPAIRKFYDPTNTNFDARTVAREAFSAGNDLLYVDKLVSSTDTDAYDTLAHILDYFVQKYREDAVFAQRVDDSVLRILTLKYHLYPDFSVGRVQPADSGLAQLGASSAVTFDVARRAVTLISPAAADLPNLLPRAPDKRERILFITDAQSARQCSTCAEQPTLAADALQSAVLRLYGPKAGGQVSQGYLSSFSFTDLWKYLNGYTSGATASSTENGTAAPNQLEVDFKSADWVVLAMVKPEVSQPETLALRKLLAERTDLLRNKKVIVFAFGAPYYLDATDISKISAYYGLYSQSAPFVEVAARILFQDLSPVGMSPVSVPGAGYTLPRALGADPAQVIPLLIDTPAAVAAATQTTQEPTFAPTFRVGEAIPLRTGVIVDRNHNPVPDGTPIHFVFDMRSESKGTTQQTIDTQTTDGVARAVYTIDRPGLLEIHAAVEPNILSSLMKLDITSGVSGGVTLVPATPMPTQTFVPTPTLTVTPTATLVAAVEEPAPPRVGLSDWLLVMLLVLGSASGVAWYGVRQSIARWGLRWALCGVIGGTLAYNYLALGLPGSAAFYRAWGTGGVLLAALAGVLLGWSVGWAWRQFFAAPMRSIDRRERVTGPK